MKSRSAIKCNFPSMLNSDFSRLTVVPSSFLQPWKRPWSASTANYYNLNQSHESALKIICVPPVGQGMPFCTKPVFDWGLPWPNALHYLLAGTEKIQFQGPDMRCTHDAPNAPEWCPKLGYHHQFADMAQIKTVGFPATCVFSKNIQTVSHMRKKLA